MNQYLRLHTDDGDTVKIPVHHRRCEDPDPSAPFDDDFTPPVVSIDEYFADHPRFPKELNITKVNLYSDTLEKPVQLMLEPFTLLEGEEGCWTLTITHRDYGPPDFGLEYSCTVQFGKRVRHPLVFQWDQDTGEMIAN